MNIGIVGLGLIGGSIAKAVKKNTPHAVYGADVNAESLKKALLTGAIDGELQDLSALDMLIVALYPAASVRYVEENADKIPKKCIVLDTAGVKKAVCDVLFPLAREKGFTFIGGHPMAGVEFSGFDHSREALFKNASMILVPDKTVTISELETAKELFIAIGFTRIQFAAPEEHDKMIALTSQLAHVLSSAYVKSPSALSHKGFSAGSFRDMTRVARLNEEMWTELFFDNKENLLTEIDGLIERLGEYKCALYENDAETMKQLLKEGRERKALVDKKYEKNSN
ncbi:MAG: prephenate dehydrogenase/arogenate dehydrogenase family protein [Bacillota bacterium]|nr:MAG: prephenate dehydrogenase/arogenate dehydrogenase family protein [Bacillota bacterium]